LSKIIKGADLLSTKPRIIEAFYTCESFNNGTQADYGKDELERLKKESEKILIDTEQMAAKLIEKAKEEAKAIITNAREEAEVIRSQAYEDAEKIRQKAKDEGYSDGIKQAREEIESERQSALQESRDILEEARQTKLAMMRSSETDIVNLAVAIAKKVIATELSINPEIIVNVLREALNFLDHPENITVYVNPQDLEKLLEAVKTGDFSEVRSNDINMGIRADKRISSGGCMVESEAGSVDARLESRMANVEKAVKEVAADG